MAPEAQFPPEPGLANIDAETGMRAFWLVPACISLALAACAWIFVYLYASVPGPWFSNSPAQHFSAAQMTLVRGKGRGDVAQIVVLATDSSGLAIVSLATPTLGTSDYRRIRWKFSGGHPGITLATLWRTDSGSGKISSAPLELTPDGAEVYFTPGDRDWVGRIGGIALTIRGTLQQPLVIEGVSLSPMGAADVLADRMHDWLGFKPWTGMSINTAAGGPLEQAVWLPLATAIIALTAILLCAAWRRRRASTAVAPFSLTVFAIVAVSWILLDARWLWGRLLQTEATAATFSGKSEREKHVADLDGYVYAFAEQVVSRLPKTPARVYITADDHYFGARMAYHLYPHNAYVDHGTGKLPPPELCKPGDYIVVFRRKNVHYDLDKQVLSWDDYPPVNAQLLLAHLGNAVFRVR